MDPRRPADIVPFVYPIVSEDEMDSDLPGILSMGLSAMSMMLKIKEVALLAFLLSVYATLNARHSGGVNSGLSFSFMALVMNYVTMYMVPLPAEASL